MSTITETCSWCGHRRHHGVCERSIQTGTTAHPAVIPCPCAYRRDELPASLDALRDALRTRRAG